jgi:hypothetical protein
MKWNYDWEWIWEVNMKNDMGNRQEPHSAERHVLILISLQQLKYNMLKEGSIWVDFAICEHSKQRWGDFFDVFQCSNLVE